MPDKKNVIWHDGYVKRTERNNKFGHKSAFVLLTGLSASGKSTIAHRVERILFSRDVNAYVLDGDNIRHGLNSNLTFSREDRRENLRRIVEVSKLFMDAGMIVLAAFISPFREDRNYMREIFEDNNFFEVYVKCDVKICEQRDPKGQYERARAGIIKNYTGVDSPYEAPESPDLVIDAENLNVDGSAGILIQMLENKKLLKS